MSDLGFKEFAKDLIEKINNGASESDVIDSLSVGYSIIKANDPALNLASVIKWVAVTDTLPNKGDEVMTITEDGWYRVMTFGSTGRRFPAQVTHWQRLPEPPCL